MAITAPEKTSDFTSFLPAHQAAPVFERARQVSVVMQLCRQIPMGINGEIIPVVTTLPVADWVAEGATKPATKGALTPKTMAPKKLAAIMVDSQEVVRADPAGYVSRRLDDLGEAFAVAFDYATLHNLGGGGTGTGPFATYIDQTTKSAELGGTSQALGGLNGDFVRAAQEIISATDSAGRPYDLSGWALDTQMEIRMWDQVDTTGRPIWIDLPADQVALGIARRGSVMGRPSIMSPRVRNAGSTILGYGGDWSQAVWGVIGAGINFSVSTESTVTINGSLVSLWENNLVAVRAEAEYGFLVNDVNAFVQLRNDSGS